MKWLPIPMYPIHFFKTRWSSHQNSLIAMHQWCVCQTPIASTTKAPILPRFVSAHTYIKTKWAGFWCPYLLFGSGLAPIGTQTFLVAKFKEFNLSEQNFARWPLRQQCVHVYTLAYMEEWVWSWCVCVCHVGCACICETYFLRNIDSNHYN